MKKIVPFVILLVVLVSALVWYYQSKSPSQKVAIKSITSTQEESILLYPLSGVVLFKTTTDGTFQTATASPTIIPNQSIVHTDIGKASVLLPDNSSISLDNNTEIVVNYSKTKTSIYQNFGATYHRIEKLLSGSSYQVQTAGTLASVRGTKFAVKYDIKSKKTKIAVTENKVEVATLPKTTDTTPKAPEVVMLEVGKTVTVETDVKISKETPSALQVVDTVKDNEMSGYVEEQKKVDIQLETIKKSSTNEEDFRKEMKRELFNDVETSLPQTTQENTVETIDTTKNANEESIIKKKETKPQEDVVKPKEDVTKPKEESTKPKIEEPAAVVKMDEEQFFTTFEDLFMKYFYIEDTDNVICSVNVKPEERVRIVTSFAESKGYPFTSPTLLSFAQAINDYCITKDTAKKAKLQARFDDEYPFH